MAKTAILAVKIIGDATQATASLGKVEDQSARMAAGVSRAGAIAALGLAAITAGAIDAGNAAAGMEQAYGGVDAVFGAYSDSIHSLAESAATDVNLAKDQYSEMATILGAQLKNMGIPMDDVVTKTSGLITMGSDLAAQFGGSTADAVSALSSLLRGERDPIERYGVSMNQAAVDAEKAALGLSGLTGEADKNANLQATLALLTRQTADAQGAFGREVDTASSKQQNANAEWQNAKIVLGEQLLPVMSEFAGKLTELALWVADNTELVTAFAVGLGITAAAIILIAGALKVYAAAQAIQTAAQWASNAAWLANPITWIVLAIIVAIALVVAIIVLWAQNWDYLSGVVADGAQSIGDWFASIGGWASDTFGPLIQWIKDAVDWLDRLFGAQTATGGAPADFTARMTSDATTATIAGVSMSRMASTDTARVASITSAPSNGSVAARDAAQNQGDTYNVTVNGALDANAVAAQIDSILIKARRRSGTLSAAGAAR